VDTAIVRSLRDLPTFTDPPGPLTIVPWEDAVVDALGYDPRSTYVEQFWLGELGPTGTWLLRRLAARFDHEPAGFVLDVDETARDLGVGLRPGPSSPFIRALLRVCRFGLAQQVDEGLAVRRKLPPLNRPQVGRLPRRLQTAHQRWIDAQLRRDTADQLVRHGERLVHSLLAVGVPTGEIEDQLRRWEFPDAIRNRVLDAALPSGPEAA
jgi:hypothetical protein